MFRINLTPGPSPKERGEECVLQTTYYQLIVPPLSPTPEHASAKGAGVALGPGVRFCTVV